MSIYIYINELNTKGEGGGGDPNDEMSRILIPASNIVFRDVYGTVKCMVWRLGENTILLIIYVGVGLCENMGPISSRVYYIYFESTNGNVQFGQLFPLCMNSRV